MATDWVHDVEVREGAPRCSARFGTRIPCRRAEDRGRRVDARGAQHWQRTCILETEYHPLSPRSAASLVVVIYERGCGYPACLLCTNWRSISIREQMAWSRPFGFVCCPRNRIRSRDWLVSSCIQTTSSSRRPRRCAQKQRRRRRVQTDILEAGACLSFVSLSYTHFRCLITCL